MNRGIKVLQTSALPLGYGAIQLLKLLAAKGREVSYLLTEDHKSSDLQKNGHECSCPFGADYGARTRHLRLGKATLYQMS